MRISFLCSSYEAGRDGVGDYVRRFVSHLTSGKYHCQIIALADRFASNTTLSVDSSGTEVLRIPAAQWAAGHTVAAEEALRRFAPDWVSLQMVCYAYDPRGLLFGAPARFTRLQGNARRHLMLHELWIGEFAGSSPKQQWVGRLQRALLLRTIRRWSADVIHTSNPVYVELLRRHGIDASELPLPGAVSVKTMNQVDARHGLLQQAAADPRADSRLLIGVFGSIHAEWEQQAWLEKLERACSEQGRRITFFQLGRAGEAGIALFRKLRQSFGDHIEFVELGELAADTLSQALQGLDLGIATGTWPLAGKSSTVATLLEHGVPVAVTRNDGALLRGRTPQPAAHPLLHRFDDAFVGRLLRGALPRGRPANGSDMFETFAQALGYDRSKPAGSRPAA